LTNRSYSSEDSKVNDGTSGGHSSDKRLTREILDIVTALPFDAKIAWFRRHLTVHQEEAATALLRNTSTYTTSSSSNTATSATATTAATTDYDDVRSSLSGVSLLPTVYNHGNGVTSMLPIRGTGLWGSNMDDHHTITHNNTSVNSSNRLGSAYNSSSTPCDVGGSESPRRHHHHHHVDYQQQSNLIEVNRNALLQSSVRAYLALSPEELKMPLRFRSVIHMLHYNVQYNMCLLCYACMHI
jgi:hypothetical protein